MSSAPTTQTQPPSLPKPLSRKQSQSQSLANINAAFPSLPDSFTKNLAQREIELLETTRQFLIVHNEWVNSGDDIRPFPDADYWDGVDALCDQFSDGDIPHSMRTLHNTVERFKTERDNYDQRENIAKLAPHKNFWSARELVEEAYFETIRTETEPSFPPMESIRGMIDSRDKIKVSYEQIAKMYRFVDDRGNPDIGKVTQEYNVPGSVIGPDWVDPRLLEWRAEREKRRSSIDRHYTPKPTRPSGSIKGEQTDNSPPCRETLFELWLLDPPVPVEQAARMTKKPIAEVDAAFKEFTAKKVEREKQSLGLSAVGEKEEPKQPAAQSSASPTASSGNTERKIPNNR